MLFTPKIYPIIPDIMINGVILEWIHHLRYLGVIVDNKLRFDRHISSVCQKLNKAIGALNALSSNLSPESMVTIYYSLAYSHVVQSVIIWRRASNTQINKVRVAFCSLRTKF